MSSDDKFWLSIVISGMVSLVLIVLFACTYHTGKNEMISKAPDPIAYACATEVGNRIEYHIICLEKVRNK